NFTVRRLRCSRIAPPFRHFRFTCGIRVHSMKYIGCCSLTKGSEIPLRVTSDHSLAEEWELALVAQGLSPSLSRTWDGFILSVPEEEVGRALVGLSAYERENSPKLRERDEPAKPPNLVAGASIAGTLLLFFFITVAGYTTVAWL